MQSVRIPLGFSAEVDEIHMKFKELKIDKIIKEKNWRIYNSWFQNLLHSNNNQNSVAIA